jgi:AGZA family xanthine/uracil permease-like MFS transporter
VSDRKKIGLALFSKNDLSAFWALFADNVANLMLIMTVCSLVFKMPSEVVFGHIVPGLGVALLVGLLAYAHLAHRLSIREGRIDVTALPYGISTPIMFVFLFGIIGPVYWKSSDAFLAWRVGIAAAFIGGIIEIVGSALGPWLKRHLPRAGMLGTLAGIALTFIAAVPLAEIFEHPLIGLPATVVVLIGLVALVRLPSGIPAGLLAILLGVVIGLITGEANFTTEGIGFFPPVPVFTDLWLGLKALFNNPWIFALVIPAEIYNFIETMNNVESAEAAGDTYPVRTCQVLDGAGTLLGSLFGSAFPTTVYIGHPGYKRLGGRAGYTWAVGVVLFLSAVFGFLAVLHGLVPMAAVAPILLFVGIVITAQAFQASPRAHALAVAFGMLPHLSNLVVIKWDALRLATGELLGTVVPELTSPQMLDTMLKQGAHVAGHSALAEGSILVGLAWGSATAFLVDRAWYRAGLVLASCGLLSLFGVIHAPALGLYPNQLTWTYLALSAGLWVIGLNEHYFKPLDEPSGDD